MNAADIKRLKFYEKQFLRVRDFRDEQAYHIEMRRRHQIAHHTWGIVVGLQMTPEPTSKSWSVAPGLAVDGFGREIVVPEAEALDRNQIAAVLPPGKTTLKIWIAYRTETTDRPPRGYKVCDGDDQFTRVRETFRLIYQDDPPTRDQKSPPLPYEALSDEPSRAPWPVYIGTITWDAAQQAITAVDMTGRRYVGNITSEILAPAGTLQIRDRATETPLKAADAGVAVMLEGSLSLKRLLTAEQDAHIHGNVGVGTIDPKTKLHIDGGTDATLNPDSGYLVIGAVNGVNLVLDNDALMARDNGSASPLRLQTDGGDLAVGQRFVVKDGGAVGVGTTAPEHNVQLGDASTPVSLSLRGPDGHTESSFLAFEDDDGTNGRWFRVLHDTQNNQLKITSAEVDPILTFERLTGRIGLGTTSPDRSLTIQGGSGTYLNVRANGGTHEVLLGADGAGGIVSTMTNHDLQLRAGGNDTKMAVKADGRVGIGTTTPDAKLDVTDIGVNMWFRLGNGGDAGRVWVEYRQFAPHLVLSDGDDPPRIQFQQIGTGTETNPQFTSWIGHALGQSSNLAMMGGNVGIGTTVPEQLLHIRGGNDPTLKIQSDGTDEISGRVSLRQSNNTGTDIYYDGRAGVEGLSFETFLSGASQGVRMFIRNSGNIGIGTTTPSALLHVNGNAIKPGGGPWSSASDERLKKNVNPLNGALADLLKLRGVSYEWKEPAKHGSLTGKQMGMIAQEVENVFPEWISEDAQGYKILTMRGFEALMVEALRELKAESNQLREANKKLERRVKALKKIEQSEMNEESLP
jgi:hypothetical protein